MLHVAYYIDVAARYAAKKIGSCWTKHNPDRTGPLGIEYIEEIGRGQFGEVWKVQHGGRTYALKRIEKTRAANTIPEIQPWCMNIRHANVVQCFGYITDVVHHLTLLELHETDLFSYIRENARLGEEEARKILCGIMEGVRYLHAWNIMHRDLKCENILMTNNNPVIADFGLATTFEDGMLIRGFVGSTNYMAPEILLDLPYNKKIDFWSVGVIYYAMLNGSLPFETMEATIHGDYYEFVAEVTPAGFELFENLIMFDPQSRWYFGY